MKSFPPFSFQPLRGYGVMIHGLLNVAAIRLPEGSRLMYKVVDVLSPV